ncbi:hypothetical protein MTBBW1_2500030 [Desulfamplus magnetovallimortis]|uniref:DUF3102 domain-containing protein n=1 Tax=Desulfamplus magnetovallimortis TaxID=1246637 RepID=A0A1W1HEF3_9BACT|nr:DUF3102 domain-containing protein [Desulfamplus magnetovallimortis]SLM30881.1 hypothetical protein MTBBW1_2500030 [Desulfamplus magnetovallimortis]
MKSDELKKIETEIRSRVTKTKTNAYEIGKYLVKGKELLSHGEFKPWIKNNFDFSYSTANNFMNLYLTCSGNSEIVDKLKTSVLFKLSNKKFPDILRRFLLNNAKNLKTIDQKTINTIATQCEKGEINLKSPQIQKLLVNADKKENDDVFVVTLKKFRKSCEELFIDTDEEMLLSSKSQTIAKSIIQKMMNHLCKILKSKGITLKYTIE